MDSCQVQRTDSWKLPRAFKGRPYSILVVRTCRVGVEVNWHYGNDKISSEYAADFLEDKADSLSSSELSSEVNFLYLVFRRQPDPTDNVGVVSAQSPVAEFGYGGPPVSPEAWPEVSLETLLKKAVDALTR
jgi:hypothetical protein